MNRLYQILRFLLPRITISLITIGIILFSLELYLRHFSSYIKPYGATFEFGSDPIIIETPLGRWLRPNTSVIIKNHPQSHRDIPMQINSLGFRGAEVAAEKPAGEFRILVLGDSITWADGLEEGKTWVKQLEATINGFSPSEKFRVVNGGVGDIGMKEEIDILADTGIKIHPDLVVVGFYLNDSRPPWGFSNELGYRGFFRRNSILVETIYKEMVLRQWIKETGIIRGSYWFGLLDKLNWKHDQSEFLKLVDAAVADWGVAWDGSSWNSISDELKRLQSLAKKYNFKVAIVAFPIRYQVEADFVEDLPQRLLKERVEALDFKYFDLLPILRNFYKSGGDAFFDYAHLNEEGSGVVASSIASFLLNQ